MNGITRARSAPGSTSGGSAATTPATSGLAAAGRAASSRPRGTPEGSVSGARGFGPAVLPSAVAVARGAPGNREAPGECVGADPAVGREQGHRRREAAVLRAEARLDAAVVVQEEGVVAVGRAGLSGRTPAILPEQAKPLRDAASRLSLLADGVAKNCSTSPTHEEPLPAGVHLDEAKPTPITGAPSI